jgi:hypothetical protein
MTRFKALRPEAAMPTEDDRAAPPRKDWRHRLGIGLFIYSLIPICTIELVALVPLDAAGTVTLGAVYIASGELAFLAAAALLGKPFIQSVKDKIKGFFSFSKSPAAPRPIGRFRHGLGVGMLLASLAPYYAAMGILLFSRPQESDARTLLYLLLSGEALFLASLFVLGGEFWERLKRLFQWPGADPASAPPDRIR